jgi:hypothetical protein
MTFSASRSVKCWILIKHTCRPCIRLASVGDHVPVMAGFVKRIPALYLKIGLASSSIDDWCSQHHPNVIEAGVCYSMNVNSYLTRMGDK